MHRRRLPGVTTDGWRRWAVGFTAATFLLAATGQRIDLSAQDNTRLTLSGYELLLDREQVAARVKAFNDNLPYVPGEVLVKFRPGLEPAVRARALSVVRGGRPDTMRWINDILVVRATSEPNADVLAELLARQPEVEWAQPNHFYRLKALPNDPSYFRQWNLDTISMPAAWDISGSRAASVTVAVIDSGVTQTNASQVFPLWDGSQIATFTVRFRTNPDISQSRFAQGRDFVFWNGPVLDMVGHGTHVAGTVLQETNNRLGLAGVAHYARLMPLKVCLGYWELQILTSALGIPGFVDPSETGGCDTASVFSAIRHAADNGAKVINLSLGGPGTAPALLEAIRYAVGRGAFVAISAGNEYEEGNPVHYPAAYGPEVDGAMAVGAIGRSRRRAYYSNTGTYIEIVAPGGDVRDGGLSGVIYQVGLFDPDFDPTTVIVPRFDRYYDQPQQGTSMAAPHVAGLAALLHAQGVTKPAAIEAAIGRVAIDLGTPGRDSEYGFGLVDARLTLRGLGVAR